MIEFCECGSIKQLGRCTNKNCSELKTKKRVWMISGRQRTFKYKVSYEEAVALDAEIVKHEQRIAEVLDVKVY